MPRFFCCITKKEDTNQSRVYNDLMELEELDPLLRLFASKFNLNISENTKEFSIRRLSSTIVIKLPQSGSVNHEIAEKLASFNIPKLIVRVNSKSTPGLGNRILLEVEKENQLIEKLVAMPDVHANQENVTVARIGTVV